MGTYWVSWGKCENKFLMLLHFMSIKGLGVGHSPNKQPMAPHEGHGHSIGEHSGALPDTFFS
jgi:hypothetical protein